jgi:hypothetical protein
LPVPPIGPQIFSGLGRQAVCCHARRRGISRGKAGGIVKQVAALCVHRNSHYKDIEGVDCYDIDRDAKSWTGGCPGVFHPPCRAWSVKTKHQAKPMPGEMELGLWCCDMLRANGGVLEHPAWSELFRAGRLPKPGERTSGLVTVSVRQSWWGFGTPNRTWLCFSGVDVTKLQIPFKLRGDEDKGAWTRMSTNQRSMTPEPMAKWLVAVARMADA